MIFVKGVVLDFVHHRINLFGSFTPRAAAFFAQVLSTRPPKGKLGQSLMVIRHVKYCCVNLKRANSGS